MMSDSGVYESCLTTNSVTLNVSTQVSVYHDEPQSTLCRHFRLKTAEISPLFFPHWAAFGVCLFSKPSKAAIEAIVVLIYHF